MITVKSINTILVPDAEPCAAFLIEQEDKNRIHDEFDKEIISSFSSYYDYNIRLLVSDENMQFKIEECCGVLPELTLRMALRLADFVKSITADGTNLNDYTENNFVSMNRKGVMLSLLPFSEGERCYPTIRADRYTLDETNFPVKEETLFYAEIEDKDTVNYIWCGQENLPDGIIV